MALEPSPAVIAPGERLPLRAAGLYDDGSERDLCASARWSTSHPEIARVDAVGVVEGMSPGVASVEAAWEGRAARVPVRVEASAPRLRSLEVAPRRAVLRPGGAQAFRASGLYSDGSVRDLTRAVAWSSPDPGPGGFLPGGEPGTWLAAGAGVARVAAALGATSAEASVAVEAAAPAPPAFPLRVSPDGRHLVDRRGRPFRIQGEAAWSLVANLTAGEIEAYLDDRRRMGFDAILVNLIEHRYAARAPANRAGIAPFRIPGDLAAPDDAYFDFAVAAVERARARGFLVLLVPAYPGFGCPRDPRPENEGWAAEMGRSAPGACLAYGRYVARRFAHLDNVVWVEGGDCTPARGSALEACGLQILAGIRGAAPDMLHTGHWGPPSTSLDQARFAPAMRLDAVYRYRTPGPACRSAYARLPPLPAFLVETGYENEAIDGSSPPTRKYHWASLACTAGQVFGNRPVWLFGDGWRQALGSEGARDMARLGALLDGLPWQRLVPSGLAGTRRLVVAGGGAIGAPDEVAAAATPDGAALVAYVPPTGAGPRSLEVDLSALSGPATARWYDPTSGEWVPLGLVPGRGRRWFTTPGRNRAGLDDWVLVIARPAEAAEPPGGRG